MKSNNLAENSNGVGGDAVIEDLEKQEVKESRSKDISIFWHIDRKGYIKIDYADKLRQFLISNGFYSLKQDDEVIFIQVKDNVIRQFKAYDIKHFVMNYVEKIVPQWTKIKYYDKEDEQEKEKKIKNDIILASIIRGSNIYFSKSLLESLPTFTGEFLTDTKDKMFFFYQNCFVEVSKNGYQAKNYKSLPAYIWENDKLERNFTYLDVSQYKSTEHDPPKSEQWTFIDFIHKICSNNEDRLIALTSALGYQLHVFYDYTMKALNLTDSVISETNEANGRSGKTIIGKAIGKMRKQSEINGKNFKVGYAHRYDACEKDTRHIHINDLDMEFNRFDFKAMYADITESIEVNKKSKSIFNIRSKIMITSNKTIQGSGQSHKARLIEFEVSDFFNAYNEVDKFYKDWFWTNWTVGQWQAFDNFMLYCCACFLKLGKVVHAQSINLEERKLREATCPEFMEFMEDDFEFDRVYSKQALYERFLIAYPMFEREKWFRMRVFLGWIRLFAKSKNYHIDESKKGGDGNRVPSIEVNKI